MYLYSLLRNWGSCLLLSPLVCFLPFLLLEMDAVVQVWNKVICGLLDSRLVNQDTVSGTAALEAGTPISGN